MGTGCVVVLQHMYVADRMHSRRWSNYKGNWLQFPTTKGPACQPACPDSEFKLIRHTDFDTLNAIIWQQDENIFIHCVLTMQCVLSPSLSLSFSLSQSLFIAATPPQSVSNAPDAKAALSLSLSPSSRFVRSWLLVQGAGDNCSLVANISMPFSSAELPCGVRYLGDNVELVRFCTEIERDRAGRDLSGYSVTIKEDLKWSVGLFWIERLKLQRVG